MEYKAVMQQHKWNNKTIYFSTKVFIPITKVYFIYSKIPELR